MKNIKPLTTFFFFGFAAFSLAQTFNIGDIVNWTGTGVNEAVLVIDWHDRSTYPSLAWGYRWDGIATGEQMLDAIANADPDLYVHITSYAFGDAVDTLGFNGSAYGPDGPGNHYASGFGTGSQGFWDYWLGSGTSLPDWTESGVGFGDRTLVDDSWDGWSWAANFVDTPPSDPIIPAPIPAPEPPAIMALLIGVSTLTRRRCSAAAEHGRGGGLPCNTAK